MKNFLSKLNASRNVLYFHSASIGLLYIGGIYSKSSIKTGFFKVDGVEHYVSYSQNIPLFFLSNACFVLMLCQLLLTLLIILITKSTEASKKKNLLVESIINAFTGMNIFHIILTIIAVNSVYIPSKISTMLFLIFFFIASLSISYTILNEIDDTDNYDENILKHYFTKLIVLLNRFDFPFHKRIGVSSILIGFALISIEWFLLRSSLLVFIGMLIMLAGGGYSFLGTHFRFKKIDELQRQIILEQTYVRNKFITGILFITFVMNIVFHLNLSLFTTLGVFAPIILLSEAFIKDKYE
jgi:hypothetical protein